MIEEKDEYRCGTCKEELTWIASEHGYWCIFCKAMRYLV
jgi:DNA-directed RNA polymerase subunit RPC12/RpoP